MTGVTTESEESFEDGNTMGELLGGTVVYRPCDIQVILLQVQMANHPLSRIMNV